MNFGEELKLLKENNGNLRLAKERISKLVDQNTEYGIKFQKIAELVLKYATIDALPKEFIKEFVNIAKLAEFLESK